MPTPPGAATPVSGSLFGRASRRKTSRRNRSKKRTTAMVVRRRAQRCRRISTRLGLPGRAAEFLAPVLHREAAPGELVHLFAHFTTDVVRQLHRRVLEAVDELGWRRRAVVEQTPA